MSDTQSRRLFSAERRAHLSPTKAGDDDRSATASLDMSAADTAAQLALLRTEIADLRQIVTQNMTIASQTSEPDSADPQSEPPGRNSDAQALELQGELADLVAVIASARADEESQEPAGDSPDMNATTIDILQAAEMIELEAAGIAGICYDNAEIVSATERMLLHVVKIIEACDSIGAGGHTNDRTKTPETLDYIETELLALIDGHARDRTRQS